MRQLFFEVFRQTHKELIPIIPIMIRIRLLIQRSNRHLPPNLSPQLCYLTRVPINELGQGTLQQKLEPRSFRIFDVSPIPKAEVLIVGEGLFVIVGFGWEDGRFRFIYDIRQN